MPSKGKATVSYWSQIDHPRFFGRVNEQEVERQMPADLRPLVRYLTAVHGMAVEAIYLQNYKLPEKVVVMTGSLPLADLQAHFPAASGLRYDDWGATSDSSYSLLRGSESGLG